MILDTTFVIDLFRGNKAAVEKASELDRKGEPVFTTAVTVFELWQGMDIKQKEAREKLAMFVDSFGLLHLDVESAKNGGEAHAELVSRGIRIDSEDSMIAGIALKHAQPVLTRDRDFAHIKGLRMETY